MAAVGIFGLPVFVDDLVALLVDLVPEEVLVVGFLEELVVVFLLGNHKDFLIVGVPTLPAAHKALATGHL